MKDNISTLLDYLWHHYESWISAAELSQLLHVSTRQIRKYISILNEEHVADTAESDNTEADFLQERH